MKFYSSVTANLGCSHKYRSIGDFEIDCLSHMRAATLSSVPVRRRILPASKSAPSLTSQAVNPLRAVVALTSSTLLLRNPYIRKVCPDFRTINPSGDLGGDTYFSLCNCILRLYPFPSCILQRALLEILFPLLHVFLATCRSECPELSLRP